MNYPKEFYVKTPIVGDKVWLDSVEFSSRRKAFHGPWWIKTVHPTGVRLMREKGPDAIVLLSELLRMSMAEIKKMTVLPARPA